MAAPLSKARPLTYDRGAATEDRPYRTSNFTATLVVSVEAISVEAGLVKEQCDGLRSSPVSLIDVFLSSQTLSNH